MGLNYERPWLKGQPGPLKLIYCHCLIMLYISSDYNDTGFNSFQKIIFSKNKSHLIALGNKFDVEVK